MSAQLLSLLVVLTGFSVGDQLPDPRKTLEEAAGLLNIRDFETIITDCDLFRHLATILSFPILTLRDRKEKATVGSCLSVCVLLQCVSQTGALELSTF